MQQAYRALHDFLADTDSDELTLSAGEIVSVVRANGAEVDEGWIFVRRDDGAKGFVPIGYIEQVDAEEIARGSSDMSVIAAAESSEQDAEAEEDEDKDEEDLLPTWGASDADSGSGMKVKETPPFSAAPVASEEGDNEGKDGVDYEDEAEKEEDDNMIPSWGKLSSEDKIRTDQLEEMETRLAGMKSDSSGRRNIGRIGKRLAREALLAETLLAQKNMSDDDVDVAEDVHLYADADISLYDLASNNNSFLVEGTTTTSTPNFRNSTVERMANDSSIAASLTGISLPPSTANRSRIATPGAKSEYRNKLRERSGGSCLVKPLFMSAVEGGDSASLATLTEKYFESTSEGKLQQEPLLEELDMLSSIAERSVKTTTSLIRRMSDLNDYIVAQKSKIDLAVRSKHRKEVESKANYLATPKKNDHAQRTPHSARV